MHNNHFIKSLLVGQRFCFGELPPMTVESIRSEGGRTLVHYRLDSGHRGSFHRPGLTVVEVL